MKYQSNAFKFPMPIEPPASFRRYRAPQEDGETLIDPPRHELPAVVARNRQRLAVAGDYDFQGRSLADLANSARCRLVREAIAYTSQYRDLPQALVDSVSDTQPPAIILSGHQPQLYHPGVWYKNFVLGGLARQVGGVGVHLIIDSDLCRGVSMRVPSGTPARPTIETLAFDQPAPEVPYEERAVRDLDTFGSFGDRVAQSIGSLIDEPLVKALWPLVLRRLGRQSNLGLCLAQGRHALEAKWRNETLELPQSAVCRLPEFAWFTAHLLAHLPRFLAAHNGALAEYRHAHHLRNHAQPVPDLTTADDWLEAPLWMWTTADPQRRPMFARQREGRIEISDLGQRTFSLTLSRDGDATATVADLLDLAKRGIKIRTRALATTLFARLVLGDLFLHGIGGAKYDQVTNLMAREFFGFDLPEFATVSATLRLNVHRPQAAAPAAALPQELRDLRYHPERFLADDGNFSAEEMSKVAEIVAGKRHWIELPKSPQNARDRHNAISTANDTLQPYIEVRRNQLERQRESQEDERRASAILDSREYSFCLYPSQRIERLLLDAPASRP